MSREDKVELVRLLEERKRRDSMWRPLPGPQTTAFESKADIVGYGGAAGGGKTDLACGKALRKHKNIMILRRESTQLTGVVDRLEQLLGTKDGYNGTSKIWRLKDRQIEFGSLPHLGDERKYQGRPHDFLCVGKGTPVQMADGSVKPIETIQVGDFVKTLEGPRKVNRRWPVRCAQAVRMTVGDYSQVHSLTHATYSGEAWITPADFFEAKESRRDDKPETRSLWRNPLQTQFLSRFSRQFFGLIKSYLGPSRLSLKESGASVARVDQEIYSAKSSCQRAAVEQHFSNCAPPMPQQPYLSILETDSVSQFFSYDTSGERKQSKLQDFLRSCLVYFRRYGEHTLELSGPCSDEGAFPVWLHQSNDAEQPTPNHSLNGEWGRTPKCNGHISSYLHPYTMEIRSIESFGGYAFASLAPVGVVELYDIEVEGSNHYITGPGIINKNCFDEASNFLESQVRFLLGWLRTTVPGQHCQALFTFNPPTSAEGQWIISFFAPWIQKNHPNPAKPGELRWFATIEGKDVEVKDGEPFEHEGELIQPLSRTFIPSRVTDNPYLMGTGYMSTLQALPEPLRSQMLNGDFSAGIEDDPFQVIPTKWVEDAMARWVKPAKLEPMDSLGVDIARGGKDKTVIARRHGMWFDEPLDYPGKETPDGPITAGLVISATRDKAPIHIDVIGVGSSPYDFLKEANQHVIGVNVAMESHARDMSGLLEFYNLRSESWWKMREALDPSQNTGIALPPHPGLKADLCAPKWKLQGKKIKVESREDIVSRIGRSPDFASAYILALKDTPKIQSSKPKTSSFVGRGSTGWMG